MQGKLGKAVRICYGHATVMLFLECLRGVKSERSLSLLYISARDGVYTRGLSINSILVSFSANAEKDIFICSDVRKSLLVKLSTLKIKFAIILLRMMKGDSNYER